MSSLMVSNLEIMMLEFAVQKLFVPKKSIFDSVIMKKTTVMFRMLDYNWTGLNPHRTDYAPYRGSNLEEEDFHGGKSVVFAIPRESLEEKVNGIDIQIHVRKEISKYFEMDPCQNVGIALVNMDNLFNQIIRELRERKELEGYLSCFHKRQPISRSLKGTYEIVDEDLRVTGATITVYVRLSHFGKSVITEIELGLGRRKDFYAQEETNQGYPYHCKELKRSKLEAGCWGSDTVSPPVKPNQLMCHCDTWEPLDELDDQSVDSDDDTVKNHPEGWKTQPGGWKDQPDNRKNQRPSWQSDQSRGSQGSKNRRGKKKKKKQKRRSKGDRVSGNSDDDKKTRKAVPKSGKKGLKTSKSDGDSIKTSEDQGDEKVDDRPFQSIGGGEGTKTSTSENANKDERTRPPDTEIAQKVHRYSRRGTAESDDANDFTKKPKKNRQWNNKRKRETSGDLGDQIIPVKSRNKSAELQKVPKSNKSSKEQVNRRVQLLKRRRGVITVGLREEEKKICHGTSGMSSATLPPCCETSASIEPTICSNLHTLPFCCHQTIPDCKPAMLLPHSCSMDTINSPWYQPMFGRTNSFFPLDIAIFTN